MHTSNSPASIPSPRASPLASGHHKPPQCRMPRRHAGGGCRAPDRPAAVHGLGGGAQAGHGVCTGVTRMGSRRVVHRGLEGAPASCTCALHAHHHGGHSPLPATRRPVHQPNPQPSHPPAEFPPALAQAAWRWTTAGQSLQQQRKDSQVAWLGCQLSWHGERRRQGGVHATAGSQAAEGVHLTA